MHIRVRFDPQKTARFYGAELAHSTQVVAHEVNDHQVFCSLFRVVGEFVCQRSILARRLTSGPRALNGVGGHPTITHAQESFRAGAQERPFSGHQHTTALSSVECRIDCEQIDPPRSQLGRVGEAQHVRFPRTNRLAARFNSCEVLGRGLPPGLRTISVTPSGRAADCRASCMRQPRGSVDAQGEGGGCRISGGCDTHQRDASLIAERESPAGRVTNIVAELLKKLSLTPGFGMAHLTGHPHEAPTLLGEIKHTPCRVGRSCTQQRPGVPALRIEECSAHAFSLVGRPRPWRGTRYASCMEQLLVADSFRVREREGVAEVRMFAAHLERFQRGVVDTLDRSPSDDWWQLEFEPFIDTVPEQLARAGSGFPRLELCADADSDEVRLRLRTRPLPRLFTRIDLRTAPRPTLISPHIKGPNIARLAELNAELGAETLMLDERGRAIEGATTSLVWWRGNTLCTVATQDRVASVTEMLVVSIAAHFGTQVETASPTVAELSSCEVWAVNALHGIRAVTTIDGTRTAAGRRGRIAQYRDALEDTWQSVYGEPEWEAEDFSHERPLDL